MASLRIKKFEPSSISESRIIFLIGKRNTGKSVLMRDLLYHMPRPDFVLAMAPTESTLQAFRAFLPECCIYDHFDQDAVDRLVSLQRELVNRGKKRTVMLVLDDCMYAKGVLRSKSMRSIFFNGRHDHITLICAAQYCLDVEPALSWDAGSVCGVGVVTPDATEGLMRGIHSYLAESGVDGVKIDAQSGLSSFGRGLGGGPHMVRRYVQAMEASVKEHFEG